jgi:hypothetical protein
LGEQGQIDFDREGADGVSSLDAVEEETPQGAVMRESLIGKVHGSPFLGSCRVGLQGLGGLLGCQYLRSGIQRLRLSPEDLKNGRDCSDNSWYQIRGGGLWRGVGIGFPFQRARSGTNKKLRGSAASEAGRAAAGVFLFVA